MSVTGRRAIIMTLTGLLFVSIVAGFYPGLLSFDSLSQMKQAAAGRYSDANPPAMAWLWSALYRVWSGPQPMLLLQALLLSGSLGLLGWIFAARWKSPLALAFPLVGFLPFVLNFAGVVWKDMQMAYSLLAACALTALLMTTDPRRRALRAIAGLVAFLLLIYGTLVRLNAPAALAPLALLFGIAVAAAWLPRWSRAGSWAVGAAVLAFAVAAAPAFNAAVHARRDYLEQYFYLYELSGISVRLDRPVYPDYVLQAPGFRFEDVKRRYDPAAGDKLFVAELGPSSLAETTDPEKSRLLRETWLRAVREHPSEWLDHHVACYKCFLGWHMKPIVPVYYQMEPNTEGLTFDLTPPRRLLRRYLSVLAGTWLFKAGPWMLASLAGFVAAMLRYRRTRSGAVLCAATLFASGFLYGLTYFPLAIAVVVRYAYWTMLSTCVGGIMLAGEWWNSRRDPAVPATE